MEFLISQNVPICPECSGYMRKYHHSYDVCFVCHDCNRAYRVKGPGQSEIELLIEELTEIETAG